MLIICLYIIWSMGAFFEDFICHGSFSKLISGFCIFYFSHRKTLILLLCFFTTHPILIWSWTIILLQFENEEIDSDGSDIEAREDVGYESEEDHETPEEKKLRLARLYLQVQTDFFSSKNMINVVVWICQKS